MSSTAGRSFSKTLFVASQFIFFISTFILLASGQVNGLEPKLKEAVQLQPNSFEANYNLGEFYLHAGKLKEGIPYMERAQALRPGDYISGYDLALAYFETRAYPEAQRTVQKLLKQRDSAELHSLLADVDEAAGDYIPAADEYQRAARMEPSEERIFDWGCELLAHRAWDPAAEVFKRGIDLHKNSAKLTLGLGIALYYRGDHDAGIKQLCLATDLDPKEAWPYLFLGKLYNVAGVNIDEVRRRFARFVEVQPNNAQANYYYAISLWDRTNSRSNGKQVETLLRKAVDLDNSLADAHLQLGILYEDEAKYSEAVIQFQRAINVEPNMTTAHYHLVQAYKQTGDKARADQELHTFERLREQDQMQSDKERNEVMQFIVTMKGQ